ncbi:hypothetical protein TWF569_007350 [Orbilia oligospora]|uniref:PA14 domain-containing protein n=1 Tax=Orbilia oligospora TaxID=2813651 RepID=A0A7C8JBJ5_ORBOL|nr:hypothetical protein TWF706_006304 [Orbilia oligospora]KAF3108610.1 hypothetical protein TWF102_010734 [Orbilia oligospora]KAF3111560.1 hypothetical protein TWF103_003505 [Orbilia oligospora]KAF3136123.1 hypothetical protein TWF703_005768 [Orbilia oligospora]KAF3143260.1 hypothetical protein TWF569_007350 [Orbilia oligospora]
MRFSVAALAFLTALADVAVGQDSCGATAASCPTIRDDATSRASCSSYFTQNSIETSTCYTATVLTTHYNLTRTETKTFYETIDATLTSVDTITSNIEASTVTVEPTSTVSVTGTAYETGTTLTNTVEATFTSYSTVVTVSTYTATVTGFPPTTTSTGSVPSTLAKLRRRQAVTVPGDCSCFLFTSTVRTRAAYEFPTATTTITISTTVQVTNYATVTGSTTVSVIGGVVTTTAWVVSTVSVTNTLPATVVTETTTTITRTGTTTTTNVVSEYTYVPPNVPDPTACPGNIGLEVAIYDNPYRIPEEGPSPPGYNNFVPEYFKTSQPYDRNRTNAVGFIWRQEDPEGLNYDRYGMKAKVTTYNTLEPGAEHVINHRGYFYAPKTETYSFKIFNADDGGWLWVGQNAYTAWTRANANALSVYRSSNASNTFTITLTAGSYTPMRIIYANGLRSGYFSFEIKDSAGEAYVENRTPSPYLVAFACDKPQEAPPFNAFGSENSMPTGPPDASCNNAGMEAAIFDNPYVSDGTPAYGDFLVETYKYRTPTEREKIVTSIGVDWAATNVDGVHRPFGWTPDQTSLRYAILWRGFFYVPRSGKYTFKISRGDNFGAFWTGDKARSGWARANVDAISYWVSPNFIDGEATFTLVGGTFLPLRVITANTGQASRLDFEILDEKNNYYVRPSVPSAYLVRFGCGGTAYPFGDPFGEES